MKRSIKKINLSIAVFTLAFAVSCVKPTVDELYPPEASATCSDGIQNQDETDIDCGGEACSACPVECSPEETEVNTCDGEYEKETTKLSSQLCARCAWQRRH